MDLQERAPEHHNMPTSFALQLNLHFCKVDLHDQQLHGHNLHRACLQMPDLTLGWSRSRYNSDQLALLMLQVFLQLYQSACNQRQLRGFSHLKCLGAGERIIGRDASADDAKHTAVLS